MEELADAVGLSQNGLLHYFGSKDNLFVEILRRRDEIARVEVDFENEDFAATLVERLLEAVDVQVASPGMAQLSLRVTGEATEGDHVAHEYFRARYSDIRGLVEKSVIALQDEGRLSADIDAEAVAALICASWDGLQTQWMYDDSIDVRGHMTYLLRTLGVDAAVKTAGS